MKTPFYKYLLLLAASGLAVSCNSIKPDSLPDPDIQNDLELYTAFEEGEVVDLASGLNAGQTASISLNYGPSRGTFELVGANLAVYEPATTLVAYNDSLELNYRIGARNFPRKLRFLVRPAIQISSYQGIARFDRGGSVNQGDAKVVNILANDNIPSGVTVASLEVLLQGAKGRARITPDNQLEYLAGSTLTGFDRVVYGVVLSNGKRGIAQVKFFIQ